MNISKSKIELFQARKIIKNTALAEKSGITRQSLSAIKRRGTCRAVTAGRIARGLGVEIEEILDDDIREGY